VPRCKARPTLLKRHLFNAQAGLCHWCRETMKIEGCWSDDPDYATEEHILLRARGGAHHIDKMVLAHKRCNESRPDEQK